MRKLTLNKILKAGRAVIHARTGKTVGTAEQERRSRVCLECPLRVEAIEPEERLALRAAQAGTGAAFKDIEQAGICDVCGCSVVLLTTLRGEDLPEHEDEDDYLRPPECWQWEGRTYGMPEPETEAPGDFDFTIIDNDKTNH